ncbi:trypsin-like serine protease [Nonomuraea longispora]|uniref:Trypsin-like serine protease n=1 Tax=Nonomuraea longispora TaxID=1848320 RepID=A0A4R4NEM8_9ACTN|nr:trypsin-like serine protease [Nonomuraea longispora]
MAVVRGGGADVRTDRGGDVDGVVLEVAVKGLGRPSGPEFRTVPLGGPQELVQGPPPVPGPPPPRQPPAQPPPILEPRPAQGPFAQGLATQGRLPAQGQPLIRGQLGTQGLPVQGQPPAPGTRHGQGAVAPRGRLLVVAALVAALAGGAAGVAGARLSGVSEPAPVAALPRVAPAPSSGLTGLSATAARVLPSVVSVEAGSRGGSGFVVDGSGHILTNAHVVGASGMATVVLNDGRRLSARVVGADDDEDLAVLVADRPGELTPATLGRSSDLSVGDRVLAIGSPLGLSGTVTAGIVSALDREVRLGGAQRTAVQTDASINPGNSGGPLVNDRGEVVGVNTAIAAGRGGGNIGIGFAIPIDRAAPIAERLMRN